MSDKYRSQRRLSVALVGCGQIADAHLQEIAKLRTARVVAVCDRVRDLARQAGERFGVSGVFDDVAAMLESSRPDVVHITTPPHTHAPLALQSLAAGCHVYVEKPFSVDLAEAEEVLAAAERAGRLVCVGHDHLFDPIWLDVKAQIERGRLGKVVHVDSIMGYNLAGPFGRLMMHDPTHWVRRLPGGLFQNNISHAVYKVTEFIKEDRPVVWADWFGEQNGIPTELRFALRGGDTTANVVFSSEARPVQRLARIHGTRATVEVDLDGRLARWSRPLRMPGPFAKLEAPFGQMNEAAGTLTRGLWRFLRGDLQYFAGMNRLFSAFYDAVLTDRPSPTPPDDIRRVTGIMDDVFAACSKRDEFAIPAESVR